MAVLEAGFVGAPVKRKEDAPLLAGEARFVDDLELPGALAMVVVRSPYAHARIMAIDVEEAKRAEGVVAVLTGADLHDDWKAAMPCAWPVTEDMKNPPHYPLAASNVKYEGDGVAVVIADSRSQRSDAAELVQVEYEPLPAVVEVEAPLKTEAPLVHDELGTTSAMSGSSRRTRSPPRSQRRTSSSSGATTSRR